MKVICIDGVSAGEKSCTTTSVATKIEEIYEGEVYTVVNTLKVKDGLAYFLKERPSNVAYGANCFIPTSEINELELVIENKQLI